MINIILNGLLKDRKNHMIQLTRSCLRGRNSPTEFVDGIDDWSDFSLKEMTALLQRIKEEPENGSFILMTHVRVDPG